MNLKDAYIKILEGFYGCQTGDGRQKMIVQLYNQISPLPRGYRLKATDPWCAAFVSAAAYVIGVQPEIIRPECGAHEMWMKYPQDLRTRGCADAKRGDLIFYDWNQDGRIDHVGVVIERLEDCLQVLEGNFSGKCDIRHITVQNPAVYGSISPDWGSDEVFVYVDCDELNLRADPSMDAKILVEMSYGDILVKDAEADGWAKVSWLRRNDGQVYNGYCGAGYLSDTVPPVAGETITAVYLRENAGSDSKAVAVLPSRTEFFYSGDRQLVGSSVWERITTDEDPEKTGWLNTKFVRPLR